MAFKCPTCNLPVRRPVERPEFGHSGGLIGALFTAATKKHYVCRKCGPVFFGEFSPEVQAQMKRQSVLMGVVAAALFIAFLFVSYRYGYW